MEGDVVNVTEANMKRAIWWALVDSTGVRECGMLKENRTRTWECPLPPANQVGTVKRKVEVLQGTGNSDWPIVLWGRESRLHGEGVDGRSYSSKEISAGLELEQLMQTSPKKIIKLAKPDVKTAPSVAQISLGIPSEILICSHMFWNNTVIIFISFEIS